DVRAQWASLVRAVFVIVRLINRGRRQDIVDRFIKESYAPGAETSSATRMSSYPELARCCLHPKNRGHNYTVPVGRFRECLYCGAIWKAHRHAVKIGKSQLEDAIFRELNGPRRRPGANVDMVLCVASTSAGGAGDAVGCGQAERHFGMAKTACQNVSIEKVFGGECGITIRAADRANGWNMRALQPIDKLFGQRPDLKEESPRRDVLKMIDKWRPRLVIVQLPCALWTLLNRNIDYKDHPEVLGSLRGEEGCFRTFTRDIFKKQKSYGNRALLENPAPADSWREGVILELWKENYHFTSNMCMFGMVGKNGSPRQELVRWMGVLPWSPYLQLPTVSYDKPAQHAHQVCYAAPTMEEPRWRAIMSGVLDVMSHRNAQSAIIAKDSEMWKQVEELIPWQLLSIQAAVEPKENRDSQCQSQRPMSHNQKSYNFLMLNSVLVMIWFAGPRLAAEEMRAAPIVARVHQNLSRPLQPDFTRFLNGSDESQIAIDLSRRLRCSSCLRNVKPRRPSPAKIPYIGSFNARVGLDIFYLPDASHQTHKFLSILEVSGLLMVVVYCPWRDLAYVLEVSCMCWLSWAGSPDRVVRDRDGAFQSLFVEHMEEHEVLVEKPPSEFRWQSGRVEANIALWKHMAKRVIDDMQLVGPEDMKMMAPAIKQDPRIPDSITDIANSVVVHSAMTADAELAKRARFRVLADMAFTDYDRSESLKRSMLQVNRPCLGDYAAGDRAAFWRLPKNKKGKQFLARFIIARVIDGGSGGADDDNVWVQLSGHPILVSKEQLREAQGTEMSASDDSDLAELR
ncbi:unnamed protein product, partial [Prorocentrum cordatum]